MLIHFLKVKNWTIVFAIATIQCESRSCHLWGKKEHEKERGGKGGNRKKRNMRQEKRTGRRTEFERHKNWKGRKMRFSYFLIS